MNAATEEALRQTEDRIFLAVTTNITTLKGIFSPFSEISFFALCQVPGGTGGDWNYWHPLPGWLPWAGSPGQCLQVSYMGRGGRGQHWFLSLHHPACQGCPSADSHGEAWGTEGPWCKPQLGRCLESGSWQMEALQWPWTQHMLPWASWLIELSSHRLAPFPAASSAWGSSSKVSQDGTSDSMDSLSLFFFFLQISALVLRILELVSTPLLNLPQVPPGANNLTEF